MGWGGGEGEVRGEGAAGSWMEGEVLGLVWPQVEDSERPDESQGIFTSDNLGLCWLKSELKDFCQYKPLLHISWHIR